MGVADDVQRMELRLSTFCRELMNAIEDLEEATGHLMGLGHLELLEGMFTAKVRSEATGLLRSSLSEIDERLSSVQSRFAAFEAARSQLAIANSSDRLETR